MKSSALVVIAWVFVVLSTVLCGLVTWHGLWFANQATCEGAAPTAWRHTILAVGLGVYLLFALPASGLLMFGSRERALASLALSVVGGVVLVVTLLFPVFAASMC